MRFEVRVRAAEGELPWAELHGPARPLVYAALAEFRADLGQQFHEAGYGPFRMVPVGVRPPRFPAARRRGSGWGVGGEGFLEWSTPLIEVAEALAAYLGAHQYLSWGSLELSVVATVATDTPRFSTGEATLRTATPILVKGDVQDRFLLPHEPGFEAALRRNCCKKARTLGLAEDVEVAVIEAGRRRLARVDGHPRVGAPAAVAVSAAPETLGALWEWGLGEKTIEGFGWVR